MLAVARHSVGHMGAWAFRGSRGDVLCHPPPPPQSPVLALAYVESTRQSASTQPTLDLGALTQPGAVKTGNLRFLQTDGARDEDRRRLVSSFFPFSHQRVRRKIIFPRSAR